MLSFFIGKRYIRGKGFVSFISIISVLGITFGIMALIVVLSVMNGVTSEVRDRIISMTAHIKVVNYNGISKNYPIQEQIKDKKGILAYAPFIEGQALIGQGKNYYGVQVKGINPKKEGQVSKVIKNIENDISTLKTGEFNIAIGKTLARNFFLNVGDKLTLVVPKTTVSAVGIIPRIKRFTISAIFDSGHYLYDTGLVFINIDDANKLFQKSQKIDGYQLKLDDLFSAEKISTELRKTLSTNMTVLSWGDQNKAYFNAVKIEKAAMFFILMIIIVVAAFNILSTLVMVVNDKRSDIAILRTIGAPPRMIVYIFMIQGLILGVIGTILGVIGGVLFAINVPKIMKYLDTNFNISLPEELYFISSLTPKIEINLILLIVCSSLFLSIIATLYPAIKAARTHPARALSYE